MTSKAVIPQMGFFNLVNSSFVFVFTEEFYRPYWAKMLFFCLLCKESGEPLQLNCPVLNWVELKYCKGKIFIFPFAPVLEILLYLGQ